MRKEYMICSYPTDVYKCIDDFFSQVTSLYTLIDSAWGKRVYHNNAENLDLIFYTPEDMIYQPECKVLLLVTTQYDSTVDPFFLPDVVCNGMNYHESSSIRNLIYYFPAPTLFGRDPADEFKPYDGCPEDTLVINFNPENSTFMITLVRNYLLDYSFTKAVAHRTSSICFGMAEKTLDFNGGFFYGGDFVNTYEKIYREHVNGQYVGEYTYCVFDDCFDNLGFHSYNGWVADPYSFYDYSAVSGDRFPNPNNVNKFDAILRAEIDYAPMRKKDDEVKPPDTDPNNPSRPYFVNAPPIIIRNQTWAVTMDLDYYVPMVCSITNSEKALPRYTPLLSEDYLHSGRALNTLNKMSIVMPLWFMVRRDPQELDDYSYAGKNNVINFVNMKYMDTNRIIDSSFPTQEEVNKYNCFQMGSRRAFFGMKGYSGLAFKVDETPPFDPYDPSTYPEWMSNAQHLYNCYETSQPYGSDGLYQHFYPDEQDIDDADFALFVFKLSGIGVVYIKPDYTKMVNAEANGIDYDIFSDAKVYISSATVLPQPPTIPDASQWVDFGNEPKLAGLEYHTDVQGTKGHMKFAGNPVFKAIYEDGEAYLCNDV